MFHRKRIAIEEAMQNNKFLFNALFFLILPSRRNVIFMEILCEKTGFSINFFR